MVDKKPDTSSPRPEENPALKLRGLRRKARMAASARPRRGVRVAPANDNMRRVLKHPTGARFPATGSAEWPDDRFTRRRIREGSIVVVAAPKPSPPLK
jgi:hypothetical protein